MTDDVRVPPLDPIEPEELDVCGECLELFRYDDVGGYNPPCACGHGLCRSCCQAERFQEEEYGEESERESLND